MRVLIAAVVALQLAATLHAAPSKPNILLILADDLGFSDLGCYGGEVPTPHLDRLAAEGVKFTQFYNAARCCPTRASLLTGLYPHQAGMGHMTGTISRPPAYAGVLREDAPTIAELLRGAGYRTYQVGKWHVGGIGDKAPQAHPLARGFDRFHGTGGGGNFFAPKQLFEDREAIAPGPDFYITDDLNDAAVRYLQDHARDQREQPFFLHLCHTAPHFPLHARPADIARHRGKYRAGWDALRASRLAKQQQLGLFPPIAKLSPRDPVAADWNSLSEAERDAWDLRMATYAAMIEVMDTGIGRVLAALRALDLERDTVVLFLSDNGASAEVLNLWPKPGAYSHTPGAECGTRESHLCLEVGWANAANTPFREHKIWAHEGGIATPLIVRWPGRGAGEKGRWRREAGHVIDLLPTCLELAGATYPADFRSAKTPPLPGRSLVPLLVSPARQASARTLAWEHEGNRAIRVGDWKLVASHAAPWELYDLAADRIEGRDLAAAQPERVREMAAQWQQWADEVGVVPWSEFAQANYKPASNYRRKSEPVNPP